MVSGIWVLVAAHVVGAPVLPTLLVATTGGGVVPKKLPVVGTDTVVVVVGPVVDAERVVDPELVEAGEVGRGVVVS